MAQEQGGICAEGNLHGVYLSFNALDGVAPALVPVIAWMAAWLETSADHNSDSAFNGFIAIGADYWSKLYPDSRPRALRPFPQLKVENRNAPSSPVDLFVHIRSDRKDLNHLAAMEICRRLNGLAELVDETHSFRYLDNRDLTGFVDGTENPKGHHRRSVALVGEDDPIFSGGSYIHIQKYVHDIDAWERLPIKQQEDIIGRTKANNTEYPADQKPLTAHIKRTNLKDEQNKSLEILRQSMPYGSTQQQGLFFISCCRTPHHFELLLQSMVHGDNKGHYDHMLDFTRAVTGAAFFAPSLDFLSQNKDQ